MSKRFNQLIITFLSSISILFLSFNIYYFFIRRDVSPAYYINKLIKNSSDKTLDLTIYQDLVEEYERLNLQYGNQSHVVFAGDSITKRFNTAEFFKDKKILNRGIFSDTTLGLITRIEANVNNLKISKLFIMIGYNDLKYRDDDTIISNILTIVRLSKAKKKFVQSILPVEASRVNVNHRIDKINSSLEENEKHGEYIYLDLNARFKAGNGGINPDLTRDGTHPNFMGCNLWYNIIKEYILED